MLARTNKAKAFRARVALLLRDLRQRRIDQARAAGRLEAVKVFKSLTPKQREIMERTVKYKRMGLSYLEIAKLLECSKDTAGRTIRKARALGMEV
jgi:DNA-directed RNA polymerase specialized sigma24 family protein